MNNPAERGILSQFSPAWYASVMGTGGLANVLFLLGGQSALLKGTATALWVLNTALFLVLIGPWAARWLYHYDRVLADLRHPLMSNFFITMPAGCIILGTNFFLIGKPYFTPGFLLGLGLIGVTFLVGLLQEFIPPETIQSVLTRQKKFVGNIIGAALGAVTPFCSCSTIPILVGLLNGGAPFGAAMSFLIASPLLNPVILGLFLSLMD